MKAKQKRAIHSVPGKHALLYKSIRANILSGSLQIDEKLPSLKNLSRTFNLSVNSVLKALDILEKEKLISRSRGSGVYVSFESKPAQKSLSTKGTKNDQIAIGKPPLLPRKTKAKAIAESIMNDISTGDLKIGSFLPQPKVLQLHYQTSRTTIGAAAKLLEQKGILWRKGNAFIIGGCTNNVKPRAGSIHILGSLDVIKRAMHYRVVSHFFRAFEKELNRCGVKSIQYKPYDADESGSIRALPVADAIGFLYFFNVLQHKKTEEEKGRLLLKDLSMLAKTRIPAVLYNYCYLKRYLPAFKHVYQSPLYPLGMDDAIAGKETGMYLARMGHRKIAFFGYREVWCDLRHDGLLEGARNIHGRTAEILYHKVDLDRDYLLDGIYKSKSGRQTILASGKRVRHENPFANPLALLPDDTAALVNRQKWRRIFEPGFAKTLLRRDITAWASANEEIGIIAAEFLENHAYGSSQTISHMCIDENDDSIMKGITTFDLKYDQMGYLAAHCILGDIPVKRNRKGVVECPGVIAERGSVNPPSLK